MDIRIEKGVVRINPIMKIDQNMKLRDPKTGQHSQHRGKEKGKIFRDIFEQAAEDYQEQNPKRYRQIR